MSEVNYLVLASPSLKVISWNINSIKARLGHLLLLIEQYQPDIICLQEIKCTNDNFPAEELAHLPYNLYVHGQKSYNGVAILSKLPADEVRTNFDANPLPEEARFIEITCDTAIGYSRFVSLYAPNGTSVGSDRYYNKLKFYQKFAQYLRAIDSFDENIIVAGDYNIAPYDLDVYDPNKSQEQLCFTRLEQEQLRSILNQQLIDNFRALHPYKQEFSWWDYRAGSFEQNKGLRIDFILSSANIVRHLSDCQIIHQWRAMQKPSDHAPVLAIYRCTNLK